jgi:glycosyltransferase involved in cell wall biosynthesis
VTAPKKGFLPESFVVASFNRCGHDYFARVLEKHGLLSFYALGTRRGTEGVSAQHTRLNPVFGLLNYIACRCLSPYQSESFRFRLYPLFDRWVRSLLRPGQHFLTSFGFANASLHWAREHGGKTFIDAENSHPKFFWDLLTEEQKRWHCPYPPVARSYNQRCRETVALSDYVFASSRFVGDSFLEKGMEPHRVLVYPPPLNLDWFKPAETDRPAARPLTLLNTGALCLRKGTPYLLEAFQLVLKKEPGARLRLSRPVRDDARAVLESHADLPIDWSPYFNLRFQDQRQKYVERFQSSDIFIFPSLEDGFAFVVAEAMACGLPVITTRNTGASDLVIPGENGEVVPIRNPEAMAEAILKWWARIQEGKRPRNCQQIGKQLSFDTFESTVMAQLAGLAV